MANPPVLPDAATEPDVSMDEVLAVVALCHGGEHEAARAGFAQLWATTDPHRHALHRCVLAHFMADLQAEPADELWWDQQALASAEKVSNKEVAQLFPTLSLHGFYPSLHLNLAEDHRKLGDLAQAQAHLGRAQEALDALPDDGYGQLIRNGVARLAARIAA